MGAPAHSADWTVTVVFAGVALLLALGLALGAVARWCRQPAVIGEIVAGIALGPSVLGLLSADLPGQLFPPEVRSELTVLAQLGLALFMFGVGYDLDGTHLRRQGRAVALVSTASIVLPFGLGVLTGLALHSGHDVVGGAAGVPDGAGAVPRVGDGDHGVPGAGPDPR